MVPISSTSPISALRPGLAKNASTICVYSTTATSEHSIRKTSIRTRKIRGEDSFVSSISIAERGEGPEGIGGSSPGAGEAASGANMAQRGREKRSLHRLHGRNRELPDETGLRPKAYFIKF